MELSVGVCLLKQNDLGGAGQQVFPHDYRKSTLVCGQSIPYPCYVRLTETMGQVKSKKNELMLRRN